jgi:hypothetical protein
MLFVPLFLPLESPVLLDISMPSNISELLPVLASGISVSGELVDGELEALESGFGRELVKMSLASDSES